MTKNKNPNKQQLDDSNETSKESGEGFFAENYKTLVKSQREIEEVVELLNKDQDKMEK